MAAMLKTGCSIEGSLKTRFASGAEGFDGQPRGWLGDEVYCGHAWSANARIVLGKVVHVSRKGRIACQPARLTQRENVERKPPRRQDRLAESGAPTHHNSIHNLSQ
jgi:hypothetical protein